MEFLILLIWLHEGVQTRQQAQFEKNKYQLLFFWNWACFYDCVIWRKKIAHINDRTHKSKWHTENVRKLKRTGNSYQSTETIGIARKGHKIEFYVNKVACESSGNYHYHRYHNFHPYMIIAIIVVTLIIIIIIIIISFFDPSPYKHPICYRSIDLFVFCFRFFSEKMNRTKRCQNFKTS